jgi:hypothetical protein
LGQYVCEISCLSRSPEKAWILTFFHAGDLAAGGFTETKLNPSLTAELPKPFAAVAETARTPLNTIDRGPVQFLPEWMPRPRASRHVKMHTPLDLDGNISGTALEGHRCSCNRALEHIPANGTPDKIH